MVETHAAALAAALEGATTAYATRNPRSERLQHEAAKVMPGGNTRSVLYYAPLPLYMQSG